MKYCVDCKYFQLDDSRLFSRKQRIEFGTCGKIDSDGGTYVSPDGRGLYASVARRYSCGPDAKFFESRVIPQPTPKRWWQFWKTAATVLLFAALIAAWFLALVVPR